MEPAMMLRLSTYLFGVAALGLIRFSSGAAGGIILNLVYHLKGIALPKWLVIAHALISVLAFVLLYLAASG
jgi:hypothetical protein